MRGFTLIELLAVIVILTIILLISVPIIGNLIEGVKKEAFSSSTLGILKAANHTFVKSKIDNYEGIITFTILGGVATSEPVGHLLEMDGDLPESGTVKILKDGKIQISLYDGKYCALKYENQSKIEISEKTIDECTLLLDGDYFLLSENVNRPKLSTGMIAIKYNGTSWVTVADPMNDKSWYDYTNKEWANVVLVTDATRAAYTSAADGTVVNEADVLGYFVWIPRYAYKIENNYHTNVRETINVKFLRDTTNLTKQNQSVDTVPTYSASSQTNFIKHPAFTLNGVELTGFWSAKFEASVSNTGSQCYGFSTIANCNNQSLTPAFKPNVNSWRNINIGNMYSVSENMKNNTSLYGLLNTEIHSHLPKNIEWGAISYLTDSVYGKNSRVWLNNSSTYITGCSANSESQVAVAGCLNQYQTVNGINASTTGNIYGVYDLAGNAWEYVAAYVNNSHSVIGVYGSSLMSATNGFKDLYTKAPSDTSTNNFAISNSILGDAIYETSSSGHDNGYVWYSNWSTFARTDEPFLIRGGSSGVAGGIYHYYKYNGTPAINIGFRTIIAVY